MLYVSQLPHFYWRWWDICTHWTIQTLLVCITFYHYCFLTVAFHFCLAFYDGFWSEVYDFWNTVHFVVKKADEMSKSKFFMYSSTNTLAWVTNARTSNLPKTLGSLEENVIYKIYTVWYFFGLIGVSSAAIFLIISLHSIVTTDSVSHLFITLASGQNALFSMAMK